jgi:hypothetical protein
MTEAEKERAAVVAWLKLPRRAPTATFSLRLSLGIMAIFRPATLVEWMNEVAADAIERGDHLTDKGEGE